jgi:ABC-2 type transport system permease protein
MKILDIAFKDLTHSFRSVFAVGMMVIAPLMLTGLIYLAFGGASNGTPEMPAVKIGVVNLDDLPAGSLLEAPIGDSIRSMFFDESVQSWITAREYADEASARDAVDRQVIGVAVIVPADFTAHFMDGRKDVQVRVVSDPTLSIGPAVVQNMVTSMLDGFAGGGIAYQTLTERGGITGNGIAPEQIPAWLEKYSNWYADFQRKLFHDPERAAFVLAAPAAGASESVAPIRKMMGLTMAGQMIFFAFFTGAYAMMSILKEGEDGTLARLFTTPTDRTSILSGKFLAVFITVVLQGMVLMIAGRIAFGIEWGTPGAITLALTGQVVAAAGLGVLLISFVKSTKQGGPVLGGGLTALGMLGGLFTSNMPNALPEAMNRIANFTPQGWVLKTWRIVLDGGSAGDLWIPFLVLMAMGVAMFAVGAMLFRRRFA